MNLACVARITRRRFSRFSARLLRICIRVPTGMDNSSSSMRKCNVSMVGRTETAVLVLLLTTGSWDWSRELGKREHIQWLKHGMAVCLEGGTATPDRCLYRPSKHLIYLPRTNTQVTIPATPNPKLRRSRLHLLISTYNLSGEWAAWRIGTMV